MSIVGDFVDESVVAETRHAVTQFLTIKRIFRRYYYRLLALYRHVHSVYMYLLSPHLLYTC